MYRNRTVLALAATAATVALVPATGANAALLKGLQDQEMTVNTPVLAPAFLEASETAGVQMVRFNTRWDGKSSTPDRQQIDAIRNLVLAADASDSTKLTANTPSPGTAASTASPTGPGPPRPRSARGPPSRPGTAAMTGDDPPRPYFRPPPSMPAKFR